MHGFKNSEKPGYSDLTLRQNKLKLLPKKINVNVNALFMFSY